MSGGSEVVLAFCRLEEIADVPDLLPESVDGPDGFCAQMGFELCEGHFDRITVRAIGRQEQDPCTRGPDGFLGGLAFVGRQIDGVDAPFDCNVCESGGVSGAPREGSVRGKC
jgi:hypothetical protein